MIEAATIEHAGHELLGWFAALNVWTAALLAGALLADRALARRASAALRVALYVPLALRILLPFSRSIAVARVPRVDLLLPADALSAAAAASPAHAGASYAVVLAVYAAGAVALGWRAVARRRALGRALAAGKPVHLAGAPCPVLRHPELGPMVAGLADPRIVIPDALLMGDPAALSCVMKHELAHLHRGDPWLSAAIELLLAVAWPVLPLWIAAARVRHLVELACDEAALAGADATARRHYGHVLLDLAEQSALAFAAGESLHFGSTLRARIEAIAMARRWPLGAQGLTVAALVACFSACSSTAPGAAPQAGGTRSGASGEATDQYGYEFDNDPLRASAVSHAQPGSGTPGAAPGAAAGAAAGAASAAGATTSADGRLAPEVIQGVVRGNFDAFKKCYEAGLKADPKLEGMVAVRFVILPTGAVQDAANEKSSLPNAGVVQCVVDGFGRLSFPPPQGGYVTVVYPIRFSP